MSIVALASFAGVVRVRRKCLIEGVEAWDDRGPAKPHAHTYTDGGIADAVTPPRPIVRPLHRDAVEDMSWPWVS